MYPPLKCSGLRTLGWSFAFLRNRRDSKTKCQRLQKTTTYFFFTFLIVVRSLLGSAFAFAGWAAHLRTCQIGYCKKESFVQSQWQEVLDSYVRRSIHTRVIWKATRRGLVESCFISVQTSNVACLLFFEENMCRGQARRRPANYLTTTHTPEESW